MKVVKSLLALFVCVALLSTTSYAQDNSPLKKLPSVKMKTLEGATIDLKNYVTETSEHKLIVISFWATWCSPCKKELDNIIDLYEEWQADFDVEIIAISMDNQRTTTKVPGTVSAKGWDYTVFCDPNNDAYRALNFNSVPQTFVVNQKGEILYSHTGYKDGDEYELEDHLEEYAGQ
ncbi:MAG: TlpA family protein disulfide reductase [Aureispira sp.]|nr:TlpA family protein disulfide reductase [Aureispira sp.]